MRGNSPANQGWRRSHPAGEYGQSGATLRLRPLVRRAVNFARPHNGRTQTVPCQNILARNGPLHPRSRGILADRAARSG